MYPIDAIPADDLQRIDNIRDMVVNHAASDNEIVASHYAPTATFLHYWNKNKKSLFKLFGQKLVIPFDVEIKIRYEETYDEIAKYAGDFYIAYAGAAYNDYDQKAYAWTQKTESIFIEKFLCFLSDNRSKEFYDRNTFFNLTRLVRPAGLLNDTTYDMPLYNPKTRRKIKIPRGTKIMRALGKLNKIYEFATNDEYEEFRTTISTITSKKSRVETIYLSIHPLDFLTMSVTNKWSSCMKLPNGEYCNGAIEMMNSNLTVIAYTKTKEKVERTDWNDKSWRCLFYINKNILLAGKEYPFQHEEMKKAILDKLASMVEEKFGWTYMFKDENYLEYTSGKNNHGRMNLSLLKNKYKKKDKKIFVYTAGFMYNDFIESPSSKRYLCYRNPVKKAKAICLSGPAICCNCGKPIMSTDEIIENLEYNIDDYYRETCYDDQVCAECYC